MDEQFYKTLVEARMPSQIRGVLARLEQNGYDAYVVGGCIRDCLLSIEPGDWDVCTSALPEQIIECFSDFRVVPTGLKHGTVKVVIRDGGFCDSLIGGQDDGQGDGQVGGQGDGQVGGQVGGQRVDKPTIRYEVEITTFRVDGEYSDNRRPDKVRFISNVREDLARRDFTINAMAYSMKKGFADYFGGIDDLLGKTIRCVGDPDKRFSEDGLRIMRAIRFAAVFGFKIEQNTDRTIRENRGLLRNISSERLACEFEKILLSPGAKHALDSYSDVLLVFIPEIKPMIGFPQNNAHHIYDVWQHTLVCVDKSPCLRDIRLAMLFHDIGKPECYTESEHVGHFYGHSKRSAVIAGEVLKRLKYDNATIQAVCLLALHHTDDLVCDRIHIKRALNKLGSKMLRKLIMVKAADIQGKNPNTIEGKLTKLDRYNELLNEVLRENQCFTLKGLAVNGADLIAAGIPEGRRIGHILEALLGMVIEGKIDNATEDLLAAVPGIENKS